MPKTAKGRKILKKMQKTYGEKKGKSVFYASENKGTIKGVHGPGHNPRSHRKKKAAKKRKR